MAYFYPHICFCGQKMYILVPIPKLQIELGNSFCDAVPAKTTFSKFNIFLSHCQSFKKRFKQENLK